MAMLDIKEARIRIYGVNEIGNSILVHVNNYMSYIMICISDNY